MESPEPLLDPARQRLAALRDTLLTLHKALLDSERTAYELSHGPVASPGAFLQLVIGDPWFAWLQPLTSLIVQIDETLAAKRPPAAPRDFERLIDDMRALLAPPREANGFWRRYATAMQRDPAVEVLHRQIANDLR